MNLLRLAPDIQEAILALPKGTAERVVTEHKLRPLAAMDNPEDQRAAFEKMVEGLTTEPASERGVTTSSILKASG